MRPKRLRKLKRYLYSRLPLIGKYLKRRAAKAFTRDGSPEAVSLLAEAATRSRDRLLVDIALTWLRQLTAQTAIDTVLSFWVDTRHPNLLNVILQEQWHLSAPPAPKVWIALKTGQFEIVTGKTEKDLTVLLEACQDSDEDIRRNAGAWFQQLQDQGVRETFCLMAVKSANPAALAILKDARYAPREPAQRALFYFLTEQWAEYESVDFDRDLLRTLYPTLEAQLRKRLADCARKTGRVEWVDIVVGARQAKQIAKMTDADWKATFSLLDMRRAWPEIWEMASCAPAVWSVRFLQVLHSAGWKPEYEPARNTFERISRLAEQCSKGSPEGLPGFSKTAFLHHKILRQFEYPPDVNEPFSAFVDCMYFLAISPDGKLLASGDSRGRTKLWRFPEGEELRTLEGYQSCIKDLKIDPEGRFLLSGNDEGMIHVWDLPEGRLIKVLEHPGVISNLALSPDGRLLASGGWNHEIRLWRLPEGRLLRTWRGHGGMVMGLSMSPDGNLLASGSQDGQIRLWSLPQGKMLRRLEADKPLVSKLIISPDGSLLAAEGGDFAIHLWRLPEGRLLRRLEGHSSVITSLAMSPDGQLLASGSCDNSIRLWQLPEGKELRSLHGHSREVRTLAISADGRLLMSGSPDNTARLWRLPEGTPLQTLRGHSDEVWTVVISPNGRLSASAGRDGTVRLWRSKLDYLASLAPGIIAPHEIEWIQESLQDPETTTDERAWLEFIQELIRINRQYDIEIGASQQHIEIGEFDIVLGE